MKITEFIKKVLPALALAALSYSPSFAQVSTTTNYTVDFSTVTVNAQKQAAFTTEINSIFNNLKAGISYLNSSGINTIRVVTPKAEQQACPSATANYTTYGCFNGNTGDLTINADAFGDTAYAKEVIAHEILHSFVPAGNNTETYSVYNEMITEHFAQQLYPSSLRSYDWLETYIPTIQTILSTAGVNSPNNFLAQAMYGGPITVINDKINPYLSGDNFLTTLSRSINVDKNKTSATNASQYLASVLQKVKAANTGNGGAGGDTNNGGSGGDSTKTTTPTSFLGLSGQFLYPPCLRSDAAQDATLSCVQDSITYYTGALLVLVAISAFLYLLYGAFLYVTAFGEESKVKQGKEAIKYAIIGMIIAILARLAVALIKSFLKA